MLLSFNESTKFDLPAEFFKKWLQTERKIILKKLRLNMHVLKGLRFQLIEGRAMAQSDIKITLKT
jgi:trigger factor